jgi:hypothetical protein
MSTDKQQNRQILLLNYSLVTVGSYFFCSNAFWSFVFSPFYVIVGIILASILRTVEKLIYANYMKQCEVAYCYLLMFVQEFNLVRIIHMITSIISLELFPVFRFFFEKYKNWKIASNESKNTNEEENTVEETKEEEETVENTNNTNEEENTVENTNEEETVVEETVVEETAVEETVVEETVVEETAEEEAVLPKEQAEQKTEADQKQELVLPEECTECTEAQN